MSTRRLPVAIPGGVETDGGEGDDDLTQEVEDATGKIRFNREW